MADEQPMIYAGFRHRLSASVVDGLLFLPLYVLSFWAMSRGFAIAVSTSLAVSVIYYAYSIVGHAVWGRTIGKRAAGIRVRTLEGNALTWGIAFKRSSVDVALGIVATIGYALVLMEIPEADFAANSWSEISEQYNALRPAWVRATEYAYWLWLAGEVFSVLFNRRRRAIHDFIGGTVVVLEGRAILEPPTPTQEPPTRRSTVWAIIDHAGGLVGCALGIVFVPGAFYSASVGDSGAFTGTLMIAVYGCVVAILFALARRASLNGRGYHGMLRTVAAAVLVTPAMLLGIVLAAFTGG